MTLKEIAYRNLMRRKGKAAFVLAVLVGLISSAYPALLAARLDPNEALRAL